MTLRVGVDRHAPCRGGVTLDSGEERRVWTGPGPKPWWFDDPELAAMRRRVLEEFSEAPREADDDEPTPDAFDAAASSNDDSGEERRVWTGPGPKPWWFDDPELAAMRRRVLDELANAPHDRGPCVEPDVILNDVLSGTSVRTLAQARDELAAAKTRYAEAIARARTCGLSWGEIGSVLGVPRQLLHRRYARRLGS